MDYMLKPEDFVGVTFWIISVSMVASTAFFFLEANSVSKHWATSVRVAGLVTLIAAVHYYYMRDVWVSTGESPTVYRYIDWLLTVPLQMIEFYLILAAVTIVPVLLCKACIAAPSFQVVHKTFCAICVSMIFVFS